MTWCVAPSRHSCTSALYSLAVRPLYLQYQRDIQQAADTALCWAEWALQRALQTVQRLQNLHVTQQEHWSNETIIT